MSDTYNGYTNKPTWLLNLWLENDEANYAQKNDMVRQAKKSDEPAHTLARLLEQWADEQTQDMTGFHADLIGWAVANINFYEVATLYLEDE